MTHVLRALGVCTLSALAAAPAAAWDAHGHRLVTHLALDSFAASAPAWVLQNDYRTRIAFESNECDRWKGTPTHAINHVNRPEHFIDIEQLWPLGMTFDALPPLRRSYIEAITVARTERGIEPLADADSGDAAQIYHYPGFLPHAILEHYEKLRASFTHVRVLESLDDPTRAEHLTQARANAVYHMGMLSHFVADAAQPLHTTIHFNGWTGDNPEGYTTDTGFHARIDGGVLEHHGIDYASVAGVSEVPVVDPADPWPVILAHIGEAFELVEPLYVLERDGGLMEEEGKRFIEDRLRAGGAALGALYAAAWEASEPTDAQAADFVKYDNHRPDREPHHHPKP